MQIEEKTINEESQLIELIKEGVNPFNYIKNERDIDFVSSAVAHINKSEDSYWDDSAETLLKSFIYYLLFKAGETKTLKRCKEIVELGLNEDNSREKIKAMVECDERSKVLFKPTEIASDKTYKGIFETLNNKLFEILK